MFRRMNKQDRDDFLRFTRKFYASEAVDHNIPELFHEDAFEEMLRSEIYMVGYMIEIEGHSVGYAIISKTYSHEGGGIVWWIEELYIEPLYRGKGLGRAFFEFIECEKDQDVTRVRLEVEIDNEKAIKLYKSCGFEVLAYGQMVRQIRKGDR